MNFCHLCAFYGECMKLVAISDSCENAFPMVTEVLGGLLLRFADTRYPFHHVYLRPSPPLHWQHSTCLDPLIAVRLVGEPSRCKLQPAAGHIFGLDCDGNPVSLYISMVLALTSAGRARSSWKKQNLMAKQQGCRHENAELPTPALSLHRVTGKL